MFATTEQGGTNRGVTFCLSLIEKGLSGGGAQLPAFYRDAGGFERRADEP
jgi:hypothetical protein